jgi:hypothetical protein
VPEAIRHALVAFVVLASAACGSGGTGNSARAAGAPSTPIVLTRVGEAVQVTERQATAQECEFITDLALRNSDPSDADAMRALRNQAGAAGANLVLLVMESRSVIARAEGYLCADQE